jgi:hypothetical protein
MSLDKLNDNELQKSLKDEKNKQNHDLHLKIREHIHRVMVIVIYAYLALFLYCVCAFILDCWIFKISTEKLSLLLDTIIKISIGMVIGKISNVLAKED